VENGSGGRHKITGNILGSFWTDRPRHAAAMHRLWLRPALRVARARNERAKGNAIPQHWLGKRCSIASRWRKWSGN